LNGRNYAALLLVCLVICTAFFAITIGAPPISSSQATDGNPIISPTSRTLTCQHDTGSLNQNTSIVNTWAIRTVNVQNYGLVTVNDTVMIRNNGSFSASYWTFYLPPDTYPNLRYMAAFGNGTSLDVVGAPSIGSFVAMRVGFDNTVGLAANSSLLVTLIQQYFGILKPINVQGSTGVSLFFYRYLVSPYYTMNYTTKVNLPAGSVTTDFTRMTTGVVDPFNCTRLGTFPDGGYDFLFESGQSETVIEASIDRVIEVNVDGYLYVTETHTIRNDGPQSITNIFFVIPLLTISGSFHANDYYGRLSSQCKGANVTVNFPYSLQVNGTFTYYISYRTYIDSYRTFENGVYLIRMLPVTLFNSSVTIERTSVLFPPYAQVQSASGSPTEISLQANSITVSYVFQDVTPLNTGSVELSYTEDLANTFQRPMILALGIFVIALIYIVARKVYPRAGPEAVVVKQAEEKVREVSPTVKEFCTNYEEKMALILELEKLAEDRRKGRVSKRAYVERLQLGRKRIATLTNSINEDKKKLIPVSKRFTTFIRQLDTYEEERENARASLENLELRRRQGKVSGDVYNNLKYENTRKIEKATAGIDSTIVQFRQEAE
jgi:hypothetical protein